MALVSIPTPGPLVVSRFVARPNRFLLRCRLDGRIVEAHLPDPGRLRELLLPGRRVWLRPACGERKTRWSAVLTECPGGLVSIDTTLPNRLVEAALRRRAIRELAAWRLVRREVAIGESRFDFLLARGRRCLPLEVKSVTLVEDGTALFPDAKTERGARHVRELAGLGGVVLFVVQRSDARRVHAAPHIDPDFARALAEARRAGVLVFARRCRISTERIILGPPIDVV